MNIKVKLDMDGLNIPDAKKKASYPETKDYVLKQTGSEVIGLYIAQMNQKCDIIVR